MAESTRQDDERDSLYDALSKYLDHVTAAYKQFEDKRPVMLYDIQEIRIYAYDYEGFKSELSPSNQGTLAQQYEQAQDAGKMVIGVVGAVLGVFWVGHQARRISTGAGGGHEGLTSWI